MSGLGHFPAIRLSLTCLVYSAVGSDVECSVLQKTENPKVFVGYLLQAIDHIPKEQLVLRSVHSAASSQK